MKSIALLATALFLASAPTPDSATISEMSAGFLSSTKAQPLLAAEPSLASETERGLKTRNRTISAAEELSSE